MDGSSCKKESLSLREEEVGSRSRGPLGVDPETLECLEGC